MVKGSKIPEILTVAGLLDRTLWVLKHYFVGYMKICFVTYMPAMLLVVLLWNLDILNLDNLDTDFWRTDLIFFVIFVTAPTVVSDLALQYYTSFIVRDNPNSWWDAVKMVFSWDLPKYALIRLLGSFIMVVVGSVAIFIMVVPYVGFIGYWVLVVGTYTFAFGMSAPIIAEEKLPFFKVLQRNLTLGGQHFGGSLVASVGGTLIMICVLGCILVLFLLLSLLVISLMQGQKSVMVMENFAEQYIFSLLLILVPMLFALFFAPLKSIYYSVLYYNLKARREGFHLENELNIYIRELDRETAERQAESDQEATKMSATA